MERRITNEDIKKNRERRRNLEKVRGWLDHALEDLNSSKALFESKNYSNSVYLLCQSVEKTTKAYAIIGDLLQPEEVKKAIGHNPLKMYDKDVKKNKEKANQMKRLFSEHPELNNLPMMKNLDFESYLSTADQAEKIFSDVIEKNKILSDDPIMLLVQIEDMRNRIEKIEKMKNEKLSGEIYKRVKQSWKENISEYAKLMGEKNLSVDEKEKERLLSISEEMIRHISDRMTTSILLGQGINAVNVVLNLLMVPHSEISRYPSSKKPLEYYSLENPLVADLDDLHDIQRRNLALHKEFLQFCKSNTHEMVIED